MEYYHRQARASDQLSYIDSWLWVVWALLSLVRICACVSYEWVLLLSGEVPKIKPAILPSAPWEDDPSATAPQPVVPLLPCPETCHTWQQLSPIAGQESTSGDSITMGPSLLLPLHKMPAARKGRQVQSIMLYISFSIYDLYNWMAHNPPLS